MPALTIDSHGIDAVAAVGNFLNDLLSRAESIKPTATIEPPLEKSDFDDLQGQLNQIFHSALVPSGNAAEHQKTHRFAIIETAVRDTFGNLIVSFPRGQTLSSA